MNWQRTSIVRFTEPKSRREAALAAIAALATLTGCVPRRAPAPAPSPTPSPAPAPGPAAAGRPPAARERVPAEPAPARARHWDEYRVAAARRMVAANPKGTYLGVPPEPLLAIPVLEIELHADGSIARIAVQRQPRQALDTVQLAIDAVRRAAPFGPVSHLPRPWKFSEVFLFDDERRFKPRSLD